MPEIINSKNRGHFYSADLRTRCTLPVLKQSPVDVSRGREVQATKPGTCDGCQDEIEVGEWIALMVPPPGTDKAWHRLCIACSPRVLPKPKRWEPAA